jgi:hypothetical protein
MEPTKAAILGRFGGDRNAARNYCLIISVDQVCKNKVLSDEYWDLAAQFRTGEEGGSNVA